MLKTRNLNKKNFWNDLMIKYPETTKKFCEFIDEFKKDFEWDKIFKKDIKFHDIPLELQIGILKRFIIEQNYKVTSVIIDQIINDTKKDFIESVIEVENLLIKKQKLN